MVTRNGDSYRSSLPTKLSHAGLVAHPGECTVTRISYTRLLLLFSILLILLTFEESRQRFQLLIG